MNVTFRAYYSRNTNESFLTTPVKQNQTISNLRRAIYDAQHEQIHGLNIFKIQWKSYDAHSFSHEHSFFVAPRNEKTSNIIITNSNNNHDVHYSFPLSVFLLFCLRSPTLFSRMPCKLDCFTKARNIRIQLVATLGIRHLCLKLRSGDRWRAVPSAIGSSDNRKRSCPWGWEEQPSFGYNQMLKPSGARGREVPPRKRTLSWACRRWCAEYAGTFPCRGGWWSSLVRFWEPLRTWPVESIRSQRCPRLSIGSSRTSLGEAYNPARHSLSCWSSSLPDKLGGSWWSSCPCCSSARTSASPICRGDDPTTTFASQGPCMMQKFNSKHDLWSENQ